MRWRAWTDWNEAYHSSSESGITVLSVHCQPTVRATLLYNRGIKLIRLCAPDLTHRASPVQVLNSVCAPEWSLCTTCGVRWPWHHVLHIVCMLDLTPCVARRMHIRSSPLLHVWWIGPIWQGLHTAFRPSPRSMDSTAGQIIRLLGPYLVLKLYLQHPCSTRMGITSFNFFFPPENGHTEMKYVC